MIKHQFSAGSVAEPSAYDLAILARITQQIHYAQFGGGIMVAHPGQPGSSVLQHWSESAAERANDPKYGLIIHRFPPGFNAEQAAVDLAELARIRRTAYIAAVGSGLMLALAGQKADSVLRHYQEALAESGPAAYLAS